MRRGLTSGLFLLFLVAGCNGEPDVEWDRLESMAVARSEHPAVVWDELVVVVGGLIVDDSGRVGVTDSIERMDPAKGEWATLPPLPAPRHHSMAATVGDRLFVIGGYSESGFDPVSDVWELVDDVWVGRSPLPTALAAGGAVTVDEHVYVVGGAPDARSYRYDVNEDLWYDMPATSSPREHLAVTAVSGQIWALGGRWGPVMHDSVEIFDVDSGTWVEGPPMMEARSGFGAVAIGDHLYVAGGEVFGPDRALQSVESFDLESASWVPAGLLPEPLHGIPLVAWQGDLIVMGGSTRPGAVDNPGNVWSIDPLILRTDGR